jgi:diguanylate cyclase (GGDEF)-like protein
MQDVPSRPLGSETPDDAQQLLDALPIPAAEIGREPSGSTAILRANDSFRALVGYDERLRGALAADVPLLCEQPIAAAIQCVLEGGLDVHQFETAHGDRQFQVRVARLGAADRCLLTLIDRTAEIGVERSFRPEPLRDSLTGLPNRRAFEARVGEVLGHPNFEETSHALLTVRLSNMTEDGAEDELLIAASGRLLSALRAGDLLARTGQSSFAILMRLERGQPDAVELAERLKAVLAAPFRLSSSEATVDSAIECARLRAVA